MVQDLEFHPLVLIGLLYMVLTAVFVYFSLFFSEIRSIKLPRPLPVQKIQIEYSGRVCIIIPTRNEADNIQTVLSSLLEMEFRNFRVMVTDRSTDETLKVANDFLSTNSEKLVSRGIKVTLLSWDESKNYKKGRVGQFKNALDTLPEDIDIIALADADGVYGSEWLTSLLLCLSKGYDMVSTGFTLTQRKKTTDTFDELDNLFLTRLGQAAIVWGNRGWIYGASVLFKRRALDDIGGFDAVQGAVMDDSALANEFFKKKKKLGFTNDSRAIVSVAPVESPIKQKIRWAKSNWEQSDIMETVITISTALAPLMLYLSAILAIFGNLLTPTGAIAYGDLLIGGAVMLLIDTSIIAYLLFKARMSPTWLPLYFIWVNFVSRLAILYSFLRNLRNQ